MNVQFHRDFIKIYKKRVGSNKKLDTKFKERAAIFSRNPENPVLKDHSLRGKRSNCRAFSITGDIRVVYRIENNTAYFIDIGSHNQVY